MLIEAQANGCYCITSSEVPDIAKITNNFKFIDLAINEEIWATQIIKLLENYVRKECINEVYENGYEIKNETQKLEKLYIDLICNNSIELFGLPGAGKSSYCKENLKDYLNLNEKIIGISNRILRNLKKMYFTAYAYIFRFKLIHNAKKILKDVKFKSIKTKLKMHIYLYSTIGIINKRSKSTYTVMEEGLLQVLWGICYSSHYSKEFIRNYINLFNDSISNTILYINTNPEIILKRLENRKSNGGSELEHEIVDDKTCINRAINIKDEIIDEITKYKNVIVKECY